jgi:histidinol phosphatase-like PHP family hydrolase
MRRFDELVGLGLATGVAHPFLALGFIDRLDAILSRISDERFLDSFGLAAAAGVSIEMHADMFPGPHPPAGHAYGDETFLRIMSLAYRSGCRFHFGSDAHDLEAMDGILKLGDYADMIGITADDVHPAFRS